MSKEVNIIGIDRCRFSISTIAIDRSVFKMHIEEGKTVEIVDINSGEIIGISEFDMTIKGVALNDKDDYTIKLELMKKLGITFVLDVNVPKLLYNSNENNVNNLEHLAKVNAIIEKKLKEVGVIVDMEKAKLTSIEVNINNNNPKLYDSFKMLKKGMLNGSDKVFSTENKEGLESLMIKNSYLKVKIYNKAKQLDDTFQLRHNESLIRIEVSTSHKKTMDTLSYHNPTVEGIIKNWDKLEKWFKDTLKKQIKTPTDKFNQSVIDSMVEQLKEGHKTYDVLIEEGIKGNLVDIELFSKAMKKYYKEVGKTKPHSVINNTKKRLENKNKALYDSLVGNIETLDKLWKDLGIK